MPYTNYSPDTHSNAQLIDALFLNKAGLSIDYDSFQLRYGVVSNKVTSLSFYDGSLNLGIGAGLFLSTGSGVPGQTNTSGSYSGSFTNSPAQGDEDLSNAIHTAFGNAGAIRDTTSMSFSFQVTDPAVKSVRFDLIFGSEEYPEYSDSSYVDIAGVFINGVNHALFNGMSSQPLSVLKNNLSAGNFINNTASVRQIEFDGVSSKLEIIAPVQMGTNTIKIGVADTGDSAWDSGLFVANFAATNIDGFGLADVIELPPGKTPVEDTAGNQIYKLGDGYNHLILKGGNDVVEGSPQGVSYVNLEYGLADLLGASFANGVLSLQGPTGSAVLSNISKVGLQDILVALDTHKGQATWNAMALLNAAIEEVNIPSLLSQWSAAAENTSISQLAQNFLNHYFPQGLPSEVLVAHLLKTLTGVQGTTQQINDIAGLVGTGNVFANNGELFAAAAQLDLNTNEFASLVGNPVALDKAIYDSAII